MNAVNLAGWLMIFVGVLFWYAAVKNKAPWAPITDILS